MCINGKKKKKKCQTQGESKINEILTQVKYFSPNRMTISDYNTKPIHGDRAISFLKLHGFT